MECVVVTDIYKVNPDASTEVQFERMWGPPSVRPADNRMSINSQLQA